MRLSKHRETCQIPRGFLAGKPHPHLEFANEIAEDKTVTVKVHSGEKIQLANSEVDEIRTGIYRPAEQPNAQI
jgi:hypothetical protein